MQRPGPKPRPIVHGSQYAYSRGCRCDECRAGNTERKTRQYQARRAQVIADPTIVEHGTFKAANTWGCPCDKCKAVRNAYARDYHRKKRGVADDEPLTPMERYSRIKPFGREWLDDPVQQR